MKNEGRISISRPQGGCDPHIKISIRDVAAVVEFLEVEIPLANFSEALTGLISECKFESRDLEKVGKIRESMKLEFELPAHDFSSKKEVAAKEAKRIAPEGWTPSLYFRSQDSFFKKDGVDMARTTAFKWVEK